jgi:hypothetical protein
MAWSLTGRFIETCSCNMFCPCWFAVQDLMIMDQGWCATALVVPIDEGQCDGVDLSGCKVVLGSHFPGPTLFDGDATARLYLDEGTTAEQRDAVEAIFQGRRGGPMVVLAGLISTWLATQVVAISFDETGDVVTATVGSVGRMRSERLRNENGQVMTMQNVGFAVALAFEDVEAELAPSKGTEWSDPELPVRFANKSGAVGRIRWQGD